MAVPKVKRSIHLAQPKPERPSLQPEPAAQMPVKAHVYRTIAEINAGLEEAIHALKTLRGHHFFASDELRRIHSLLSRLRVQANLEFMAVLSRREAANAGHEDRDAARLMKEESR